MGWALLPVGTVGAEGVQPSWTIVVQDVQRAIGLLLPQESARTELTSADTMVVATVTERSVQAAALVLVF